MSLHVRALRAGALAAAAMISALAVSAMLGSVDGQTAKPAAPIVSDGSASPRPWVRYKPWPQRDYSAFNTLAVLKSPPPPKPDEPKKIAGQIIGDAAKGRQLAFERSRGGGCLACHVMGAGSTNLPGNVGPDLSEIGNAGRDDEWFYNYVFDGRVYNPETVMPPWGAHGIYSDEEIRHIVAFLKSLKTPARFGNPLDDPIKRPTPVEDRDNLDALLHPGMWAVDKARDLYSANGAAGKACAACHDQPQTAFKTWAASMPKWEPRLRKVIGVEEFVFRHAKATTGHDWLMESESNIAMSTYLRHLANGAELKVDTASVGAKEAAARGKALMERKVGQLNFACFDCHTPQKGALKWIRGQWLGESRGQLPHFPTWRTSRQEIWTLQKRFQWCNVAIQGNELPPDAPQHGDLELYLSSLNNGLKLNAPGIRH